MSCASWHVALQEALSSHAAESLEAEHVGPSLGDRPSQPPSTGRVTPVT